MNRVELVGRITRDIDVKQSQSGTSVARFTLAVNRNKKVEGQPEADFISCVAFGKTAEFMAKYVKKGYLVSAEGRIQTGSYDNKQTGQKVYTTDILCDSVQNLTPRQNGAPEAVNEPAEEYSNDYGITNDDLPF